MAERTKNRHSHTNLPGRVESPAIEIYASTGMPKDNVMPTYTHTQTFGHTINFTATTPRKLMDLPTTELYKLPEESWSDYYHEAKEVYSDIVKTAHDELDLWCMKMKYVQKSPPTAIQYDKKIDLLCQSLDPIEIDGTSYVSTSQMVFPHGLSDKKDCGQYLIINGCTPEIVKLLSSIEYLMLKKAELLNQQPSAATEEKTMPEEEAKEITYEDALRTLLIKYLHLDTEGTNTNVGGKKWNKNRLIAGVMQVLENRGKLPDCNERKYANQVAIITGEDVENLRKNISHHLQDIKPYGCNLKDLSVDYVKSNIPDNGKGLKPSQFKERWDGMFEMIDGFIEEIEALKSLR